jgi:phage portal protein BeeE
VNVIASTVMTMPCHVYRRLPRGRERATDVWQYRLFHESPNPEMAPAQFVETSLVHLLLWGNVYYEKVRARSRALSGSVSCGRSPRRA